MDDAAGARDGDDKVGTVQLIAQIHANGADGSSVTRADADGVGKIVEFVGAVEEALLGVGGIEYRLRSFPMKIDLIELAKDVTAIVEEGAADFVANPGQVHRETEFLIEDEHRLTADWETGNGIARASLVQREAAQRCAATSEQALRKGNDAR